MVKRFSKKERIFIEEYAKTGNGTQSALKAYDIHAKDREKSASVIAHQNLGKIRIQREIKSIADQIPDNLLVKRHLELLDVPRKIRTFKKGDLENEIEELDSYAIKSGLDMAYKIKGIYAPEEVKHSGSVNITSFRDVENK